MTPSLERSAAVRAIVVGSACGLALGAGAMAFACALWDRFAKGHGT